MERSSSRMSNERPSAAEHPVVLVPQDTTEINLTTHSGTTGLGYLGSTECRGLMMHNVLAVSPHGTPLGLIGSKLWTRAPEEQGKRTTRNQRSIAEKESQRWLEGVRKAEAALPDHPHVVVIGDREADIYELFAMPRRERTDLLVRVRDWRRRVEHPEKYLGKAVRSSPPRAELRVELPRADSHPGREATLTVRWQEITLRRPANHTEPAAEEPVRLWFLLAEEESAVPGHAPLKWLLASTLAIHTEADAIRLLDWYLYRWRIEQYHFVLKSGCRIESRQLQTAERMEAAIATYSIIAWRLLWLTYEARESPHTECTKVFETDEWQVAHRVVHPHAPLPAEPPTLSTAMGWIARLGGHLGRKNDGPPGVKTLWRGLSRLVDLVAGYRLATHPPP